MVSIVPTPLFFCFPEGLDFFILVNEIGVRGVGRQSWSGVFVNTFALELRKPDHQRG